MEIIVQTEILFLTQTLRKLSFKRALILHTFLLMHQKGWTMLLGLFFLFSFFKIVFLSWKENFYMNDHWF